MARLNIYQTVAFMLLVVASAIHAQSCPTDFGVFLNNHSNPCVSAFSDIFMEEYTVATSPANMAQFNTTGTIDMRAFYGSIYCTRDTTYWKLYRNVYTCLPSACQDLRTYNVCTDVAADLYLSEREFSCPGMTCGQLFGFEAPVGRGSAHMNSMRAAATACIGSMLFALMVLV